MITREQVTFTAQGENFFPSKVAAPYSTAHDPGVIGQWGRYKGKPVPYGVADFSVPEELEDKIPHLHRLVMPFLAAMRTAGAEEFRLHITYHYEDQCSIGFSKDEARMISDLGCDVPIDCCRDEQPNQHLQATPR
jgi:hypothetical protein